MVARISFVEFTYKFSPFFARLRALIFMNSSPYSLLLICKIIKIIKNVLCTPILDSVRVLSKNHSGNHALPESKIDRFWAHIALPESKIDRFWAHIALPESKIDRFWAHIVNPFLGRKKERQVPIICLGACPFVFRFFFLNGHGGHTTAIFAGVQPPHI